MQIHLQWKASSSVPYLINVLKALVVLNLLRWVTAPALPCLTFRPLRLQSRGSVAKMVDAVIWQGTSTGAWLCHFRADVPWHGNPPEGVVRRAFLEYGLDCTAPSILIEAQKLKLVRRERRL